MPTYCAHLGFQFTELALPDRFAAAADSGFAWVEHPSPYGLGVAAFAERAAAAGLKVAQIAAPAGEASRGEKGFACLPDREEAFQASLVEGLRAARSLGARYLHLMSGVLPEECRGERSGLTALYSARIAAAADRAAQEGLSILIEPIDDGAVAGYFMNDPWFARDVLRSIARPNAFLLLDVFHAHNRGVDPVAFWEEAGDLVAHVQVADAPGRHEPGSGTIDFARFFSHIERAGYAGLIGCEYHPLGDTAEGLGWRENYA